MNYDYDIRAVELGNFIVENKSTVRATAKKFGISKSTVHTDITVRLKRINPALFSEVRKVLDLNKEERHIRGGIATREKYLKEAICTK
jgi:putative DeoR family transcriptional regulator (stage III sporulation protein D)